MVKPCNPNTRMLFAVARALRYVSNSLVEPDDILKAVFLDSIWSEFSWWHQNTSNAAEIAQERFVVAIKKYGKEVTAQGRINLDDVVKVARLDFAGISPRCGLPSTKSVRTLLKVYIECVRTSRGPRLGFREIPARKRWVIIHRLNRCKYRRTAIEIADQYFSRKDVLPPSLDEILGCQRHRRRPRVIRVHSASALSSSLAAIREMKTRNAPKQLVATLTERAWSDSLRELGVPCAEAVLP